MKQTNLFKSFLLLCALIVGGSSVWAETVTLTSQQIKAGTGSDSYGACTATDGGGNTWNAYAVKNQHSNATSDYHYWQIKKYASSTAYYVQVPTLGSKITQLVITVSSSSSSKPRDGGGNTATLYFSASNSTSATGTGVVSGTGASSITIDCSSLNLNTGYITASGAVRIWDIEVTYTPSDGSKSTTTTVSPTDWTFNLAEGVNTKALSATVTNDEDDLEIDGATVTWESSNEDVATVNSFGVVTPKAVGTATITATYAGVAKTWAESSGTCAVTVEEVYSTIDIDVKNTLSFTNFSPVATSYNNEENEKIFIGSDTKNYKWKTKIVKKEKVNATALQMGTSATSYIKFPEITSTYGYVVNIAYTSGGSGKPSINDGETTTTIEDDTDFIVSKATAPLNIMNLSSNIITISSITITPAKILAPTIALAAGTYNTAKTTKLTNVAGFGDIYYTTDGSDPTAGGGTLYTTDDDIAINNGLTLKAAVKYGTDWGYVSEATYVIKPDAPVFSVEEGAVARNTVVNISSREGTTIFYTVDGSDPNDADDSGVNSINVTVTADMTIRAICIDGAANISSETSGDYTIAQVAKPAFSAAAGMVSKGTQLTVTTATEGATIYYTLDGSTPTSSSNVYSGYIQINGAHTVKAIAIKENYIDSEVMSAAYTVAGSGESIVFQNIYGETDTELSTVDGANATLTFTEGTNAPKYYKSDHTARLYNGGSLTISSTKNIIRIEYGISSGYSKDSGTSGTLTSGVWTGKSTSVKINASATCKFSTISIFYELTDEDATVGDSKLAGFCSEYKVDFSGTGLKVYKAKVDEGNVKLTEITDGIVPANTGVILSGDADDYEIPFTDASATADFSDNEMIGVTQRTQVVWNPTTGIYNYILQQGQFNRATDGYLKPNRAYLSTSYDVTPSGAKALSVVFAEDETDGIRSVGNTTEDVVRYNLSGQKVGADYKGIVIVNGKKYLRK